MLWLFDTGKMAKKFGRWRGCVTSMAGLVVFLVGDLVTQISRVIHSILPNVDSGNDSFPLILATLVFYLLGIVLTLWGVWIAYQDTAHQTYLIEAERYEHQGW